MEGWIEALISSWASTAIFAALSILELVGKCVPCVDDIIDSAMTFVVPVLSIFGSLAPFGSFTATSRNGDNIDNATSTASTEDVPTGIDDGSGRRLSEVSGGLIFWQVVLRLIGICLALLVHIFKLLLRVMGEGCCTCCITSAEYTWIAGSVTLTIFIVPIAIATAILLFIAAVFGAKHYWKKRKKKKAADAANDANNADASDIEAAQQPKEETGKPRPFEKVEAQSKAAGENDRGVIEPQDMSNDKDQCMNEEVEEEIKDG